MSTDDIEYDEELYTDTAMFDADEIVRSVEEVARDKKKKIEKKLSARRQFEIMMEDRKLAQELGETYDDEWDDDGDWDKEWSDDEWS